MRHVCVCVCVHRYRAKFIVGSVAALLAKEGGGEAWLMGLRERTYQEAAACLEELPGTCMCVCVCVSACLPALFSSTHRTALAFNYA